MRSHFIDIHITPMLGCVSYFVMPVSPKAARACRQANGPGDHLSLQRLFVHAGRQMDQGITCLSKGFLCVRVAKKGRAVIDSNAEHVSPALNAGHACRQDHARPQRVFRQAGSLHAESGSVFVSRGACRRVDKRGPIARVTC